MESKLMMRNSLFFIPIVIFSCLASNENAFAASPKSVVASCLQEIKKGDYVNSYTFFSSSLKKDVSLEEHVSNLNNIETNYGRLITFSDRHPLFKNYFLDEDMFKGLFSGKKQMVFKYLLTFEKGMLSLYAEVEKEGDEYKIKVFYLNTLE